jgi:hypothetical protein
MMKMVYLTAAVAGMLVPYYFWGAFLRESGLDLALLLAQLFANHISTFFAVDLIITAIVFLLFSYRESRKRGISSWWAYVLATLLVGPSFSLPLFLYQRERLMERGV